MEKTIQIDYSYHYRKWHSPDVNHYEKWASEYHALLSDLLPRFSTDGELLDIGCGAGGMLYALKQAGFTKASGIDISPEQVSAARKMGLAASLVTDSIEYLHDRPAHYDLITGFDLLEHLPIDAQIPFIQAIYAALKPNGVFACTVPNANSAMASRWRYIDWTHHCSFTEHSLDFVLHNGGFPNIRIVPAEQRPRYPMILRKSVLIWLLRSLFRAGHRLEMAAEIGFSEARRIPLSVNLKAYARK